MANAYVTNVVSSSVSVIDLQKNHVIRTINVGGTRGFSPTGVAVTPNGNRVYVSVTNDTIVVYSNRLQQVLTAIRVGKNPRQLIVTPNGHRVYVANAQSNTVSVINTHTNRVIHTIPVGKEPRGLAVSPNGKYVYVANSKSNSISVIRTLTKKVVADIKVGRSPLGIAFSPDNKFAYVTNRRENTVSVIDVERQKATGKILNVGGFPFALAVSQNGSKVYVTSNRGVALINPVSQKVVKTSELDYAQGIALYMNRLYAVSDETLGVVILTPNLNTISNIKVGNEPELIVIH